MNDAEEPRKLVDRNTLAVRERYWAHRRFLRRANRRREEKEKKEGIITSGYHRDVYLGPLKSAIQAITKDPHEDFE